MIASLWNVPKTPQEWNVWSFAHARDHDEIRGAIQQATGVNLPAYILDPIPPDAVTLWLSSNQNAHNDMLEITGLSGSDLQGVNIEDDRQLQAWISTHVREHIAVRQVLSI